MEKITTSVLIKSLMEFGLSDKEARIYLSLLELEIASVSEIAKDAHVNRSSTYVVLESLKEKGLVSVSEDQNVQQYVATPPDILLFDAQNKAQKAEHIKNNISDIVPELKALHKETKQKPKVKVFEGKQGFLNALDDSLTTKEKLIREWTSSKNIHSISPESLSKYLHKRIALGIKMHGIHPDYKIEEKISELFPELLKIDKSIFIPQNKYQFSADTYIYDNKIAYLSPGKKSFAMIIESKEIADVMKDLFDLAYKEAGRMEKINSLVTKYKKSLSKHQTKNLPYQQH